MSQLANLMEQTEIDLSEQIAALRYENFQIN